METETEPNVTEVILGHIDDMITRRGIDRTTIGLIMNPEAQRHDASNRVTAIGRRGGDNMIYSIIKFATATHIASNRIIPAPSPWIWFRGKSTKTGTAPALNTDSTDSTRCAEATTWYVKEIATLMNHVAKSTIGTKETSVTRAAQILGISRYHTHSILNEENHDTTLDIGYGTAIALFHRCGASFGIW
jgi:hypothetical protein